MTKLLLFAVAAIALSTNAARALDCRRLSRLLGAVTVLTAVFVSFSDRARAEDEDCSKLFKSDYLREVCSDVKIPSHRQSHVKMECSILKNGHPSPSLPRSSKVIADIQRALQDCIDQYPDLGPLQPAPAQATPSGSLRPQSPYTRGLAALDDGDLDAAIAEFTAAITKDPRDPFSYIRRATAYEKKRATALAIADYQKALTLVDEDTGTEFAAKIRKLEMSKVGVPGPRKPPARPARNLREAEPLEE